MEILAKVGVILLALIMLGTMLYIIWTFKWVLIGASAFLVCANLGIEKVLGRHTRLGIWLRKP